MAATTQPTILEGIDVQSYYHHLLDTGSPTTLVVCSSKERFLRQLQSALDNSPPKEEAALDEDATQATTTSPALEVVERPRDWRTSSLRLLLSSQNLRLAFCTDVIHLRAYLAAYGHRNATKSASRISVDSLSHCQRVLALLNLVEVHRLTSSYSAQGLNRTLSIAVDAAHAAGSQLLLAECEEPDNEAAPADAMPPEPEDPALEPPASITTWDTEVSILNVTTKSFGAGERGWVGRTVKIRSIAERWCVFERWSEQRQVSEDPQHEEVGGNAAE